MNSQRRSTPRIGIPIGRVFDYRHIGPVIEAAFERGWAVTCWHLQPKATDKLIYQASEETLPEFSHGEIDIIEVESFGALEHLAEDVDCVVAGSPPARYEVPKVKPWVHIQRNVDSFYSNQDVEKFLTADVCCTYAPFWADWYPRYLVQIGQPMTAEQERRVREMCVPVGSAELDGMRKIDKEKVTRRLGIPTDRPIVIFFPSDACAHIQSTDFCKYVFANPSRLGQLWKLKNHRRWDYLPYILNGWDYKGVLHAARQFCDRNSAFLVMKARIKYPAFDYEARVADLLLYDRTYYPTTILELLSVADLAIGFNSLAVTESIFASVSYLEVYARHGVALHDWLIEDEASPTIWNTPGCAYRENLPDFVDGFADKRLEDYAIDQTVRYQYLEKYLGPDDGKASQRIMDVVEDLLSSSGVK